MARRRRRSSAQLVLFPDELFASAGAASGESVAPATPPAPARAAPDAGTQPSAAVQLKVATPVPIDAGGETRRPRPAPRGVHSTDARAMVWLRARGESLTAIAQQFHTSRAVVLRFVRTPMLIRELEEQEARAQRS
ncbi:MAG TPA: hypothetical protein VKQ30_24955 [Ktedonobacterales bacterium]|nr:hypothetical protein [Ktedonobacterales bacterium]